MIYMPILRRIEGDLDDVAAAGWGLTPTALTRVDNILHVAGFDFEPFNDI